MWKRVKAEGREEKDGVNEERVRGEEGEKREGSIENDSKECPWKITKSSLVVRTLYKLKENSKGDTID